MVLGPEMKTGKRYSGEAKRGIRAVALGFARAGVSRKGVDVPQPLAKHLGLDEARF